MRRIFIITILLAAAFVAATAGDAAAGVLGVYPADGLFFPSDNIGMVFSIPSLLEVSESFESIPALHTDFDYLLDAAPLAEAADTKDTASRPMTIPAPPATGLLILQGMLCVGLLSGRQKWAAAFVAAMALGRAGVEAIPRVENARQPQNRSSELFNPAELAGMLHRLPEFRSNESESTSIIRDIQTVLEREAALFDAQVDAERFFHALRSVLVLAPDHSLKDTDVVRIHWARPPPC